jgi:hypothetical protein
MIIPVRLITIMGSETMFGVPYEKITASLKFKHFRKRKFEIHVECYAV